MSCRICNQLSIDVSSMVNSIRAAYFFSFSISVLTVEYIVSFRCKELYNYGRHAFAILLGFFVDLSSQNY